MPESARSDAARLQARAHEVATTALSLGASAVRVTLRRAQVARAERTTTAKVRQLRRSFRQYEALVYQDGRLTRVSSTDLSPDGVAATIGRALGELGRLEPGLFSQAASPQRLQLPPGPFDALRLTDPALAAPELARCATRLSVLPAMPASVEEVSSAIAISDGTQHGGFSHTQVTVQATVQGRLQRRWAARHLSALGEPEQESAQLLEDKALLSTPSTPPPAGPVTLVVAPQPASQLIDALVRLPPSGAMPERLSVIADPWLPGGLASTPFTEDGRATRPTPLIQGGRRRLTLEAGQSPAPGDLRVGLGGRSLARMVAETRTGVLVTGWLCDPRGIGLAASPLPLVGHKIRNGQRLDALVGVQLRLSLHDLFTRLMRVGADPWTLGPVRSPSLAFVSVTIHAGTAA